MKLFTRTGQQVVARALLTIPLLMAGQRIWAAPAGLVEDLVRGAAGVGKDVPLRDVEAVLEDLSRSRAGREVIDAELRKSGTLLKEGDEAVNAAARSAEATRIIKQAAKGLDPGMIRELENLNEATRESALVLARGGHDVAAVLPDLAIRGQFLKEGGAETVAAIGLHGPEAARAALRLDEAIKSGSLVVREGQRAVKLADFGAAMLRTGEGGWRFWQTYVVPHWKLWLAGGALAAYLADPEYFQTKAGDLTERGFQKLIELLGVLSARAIQGAGEGAKKAAEDTGKAAIDSFFTGWNSVTRILGLLILLFVVSLLFRRIRYFVLLPFHWLQSSPAQTKANHDDGQAKP